MVLVIRPYHAVSANDEPHIGQWSQKIITERKFPLTLVMSQPTRWCHGPTQVFAAMLVRRDRLLWPPRTGPAHATAAVGYITCSVSAPPRCPRNYKLAQ